MKYIAYINFEVSQALNTNCVRRFWKEKGDAHFTA